MRSADAEPTNGWNDVERTSRWVAEMERGKMPGNDFCLTFRCGESNMQNHYKVCNCMWQCAALFDRAYARSCSKNRNFMSSSGFEIASRKMQIDNLWPPCGKKTKNKPAQPEMSSYFRRFHSWKRCQRCHLTKSRERNWIHKTKPILAPRAFPPPLHHRSTTTVARQNDSSRRVRLPNSNSKNGCSRYCFPHPKAKKNILSHSGMSVDMQSSRRRRRQR